MATIKFGGGITDARGSVAGNTFSRNRGGSYLRQRVTPVNPNTPAQAAVRGIFGAVQSGWRALTESQRESWRANAINYPAKNRLGDTIVLAGNALYQSCNTVLLNAGLATITDCPVSPVDTTELIPKLALDATTWEYETFEGGLTKAAVKFTKVGTVKEGDVINVFASAQQSPGRSATSSAPRRLIASVPAASWVVVGDSVSIDLAEAYNAKFGLGPSIFNTDSAITVVTEIFNNEQGYTKPLAVFSVTCKQVEP